MGPLVTRFTRRPYVRWQSTKTSDPLSILFCGSDEFSCKSLGALYDEHKVNPGLIESIAVVTRPDKRTGRGLKQITEGKRGEFSGQTQS